MNKFILALTFSLLIHCILFVGFKVQDLTPKLPQGKTVIGKVTIKNIVNKTNTKKIKMNSKTSKRSQKIQNDVKSNQISNKQSKYLADVKKIIEENKTYPFVARTMKLEGKTEVDLFIYEDGSYTVSYTLLSEHEVFNQSTKNIFKNIKKFSTLPNGQKSLKISIPVWYELDS